jgi:hypothetical protein
MPHDDPAPDRYQSMLGRRCGRSGVMLPALSLGFCHNFGDDRPLDVQRSIVRRRGAGPGPGERSGDAQPEAVPTVAFPSGVTAALEMRKPSPFPRMHLMPAVDEEQVNGLRVIDMP